MFSARHALPAQPRLLLTRSRWHSFVAGRWSTGDEVQRINRARSREATLWMSRARVHAHNFNHKRLAKLSDAQIQAEPWPA